MESDAQPPNATAAPSSTTPPQDAAAPVTPTESPAPVTSPAPTKEAAPAEAAEDVKAPTSELDHDNNMTGNTAITAQPVHISSTEFYANYYGHVDGHLKDLLNYKDSKPIIYLAGDSTLDNKHWLPMIIGEHPDDLHRHVLSGTSVRRDVSYWLSLLYGPHGHFRSVNCAVEDTTLRQRIRTGLLEQDVILRDAMSEHDVLVVCVGGNDVANSPTVGTGLAALSAVYMGGNAGMKTLRKLFHDDMAAYIAMLTEKTKPRLVVACMPYFPDEIVKPSWASFALRVLRYNVTPEWLQEAYVRVFENAVKEIRVDGCRMAFVPFYRALDGKTSADYVDRVEPSEQGGQKLAYLIRDAIDRELAAAFAQTASEIPTTNNTTTTTTTATSGATSAANEKTAPANTPPTLI